MTPACAWRLGPPKVDYGQGGTVPLVHTSVDPGRWYVAVDTGDLGERLFFLDTGYSYSTCDDDLVKELHLKLHGHVRVHGEAGDIPSRVAVLPPFEIAGHRVENLGCVVRDLGKTSSIDDPHEVRVAGVLGADVLRQFDVIVDPPSGTLELRPPKAGFDWAKDDPHVVRLRREYGVGIRFTAPAAYDGHVVRPVIDTGASGTHVDGERLGFVPYATHDDVPVRASGAKGGQIVDLSWYRVDVSFAGYDIGPVLLTDRRRAPWAPGLLGLDVLARYEQEYDFDRGLARFTLVSEHPLPTKSYAQWRASFDVTPNGDPTPGPTNAGPTE